LNEFRCQSYVYSYRDRIISFGRLYILCLDFLGERRYFLGNMPLVYVILYYSQIMSKTTLSDFRGLLHRLDNDPTSTTVVLLCGHWFLMKFGGKSNNLTLNNKHINLVMHPMKKLNLYDGIIGLVWLMRMNVYVTNVK